MTEGAEGINIARSVYNTKITLEERRLTKKDIAKISVPFIIEYVSTTFLFIADQLMLGNLEGESAVESLAAMGIAGPISHLFTMVIFSLSLAVTAVVARAYGEQNQDKLDRSVSTIFYASMVESLVTLVIGIYAVSQIPYMFLQGDNYSIVEKGRLYTLICAVGYAFHVFEANFGAVLRSCSDARTPMVFGILSNALNIALNYALIFGHWGFPRLEITGAAIATSVSMTFYGFSMLCAVAIKRSHRLSLRLFDRRTLRSYFKVALPAVIEPIITGIGFLIYNRIIFLLGPAAVAAHRVCLAVESIAFMPGAALARTSGIITGQSLGRRRPDLAYFGFKKCMDYAFYFMSLCGVVILIFSREIAGLFIPDNQDVVRLAVIALAIAAFEQPFFSVAMVFGETLAGAGDTKTKLYVNTGGLLLIRIPVSYLFSQTLGLGLGGIWAMMIIDWMARCAVFYFAYRKAKWAALKLS